MPGVHSEEKERNNDSLTPFLFRLTSYFSFPLSKNPPSSPFVKGGKSIRSPSIASPLTIHLSSLLTPHSLPLISYPSLFAFHFSLFTSYASPLTPYVLCGLTESFALWGKFFRPGLRNPSLVAGGCHSIISVSNAVRCPAKARRLTVDIPVIYSVRYEY
jgi:hypothetical protein